MKSAPKPENEADRIRLLRQLSILDTNEEQAYDDLTSIAAQICETPIALVSLIDTNRQWFKSHFGLEARETKRDLAFCAHAILSDELFVVDDSDKDPRFADNPLVSGNPHVKFYAGAPLIYADDIRLGTLCVIDHKARNLTVQQRQALQALARQVVNQLELRIRIQELQQLDEAKNTFIATVSHELRTPLTAINGALLLLKNKVNKSNDATLNEMADIACRNTENLMHFVNDLLDVSKLEAGKLTLELKQLDIIALAKNSVDLNQPYFLQCDCTAEIICPQNPLIVKGDETRLLQVMNNLLSNAAKFSAKQDKITVTIEEREDFVHVSITDHGVTIPPEKHSLLFQKFSQINSGNSKLPGTGLGLHLCKQIIELHGGDIGFTSSPDHGTSFYFSLFKA